MSNAKRKGRTNAGRRTAPAAETLGGPASVDDPRIAPGFEPAHFPLCDGGPAPTPDATDRVERRQIEFLVAYYRLNRLLARLEAIRGGGSDGDERTVLGEIQHAIRDRDEIEAKYEPEGFLGEPVLEGLYYRDIEFTHARSREYYQPADSSHFSLHIPLPPPGVDVTGWIQQHLVSAFPELAEDPPVRSAEKASRGTKPRPPAGRRPAAAKPRRPSG